MDAVFELMSDIAGGDSSTLMVSAFVFLSAAALAFGVMAVDPGARRGETPRRRNRAPRHEQAAATTTRARCATPARSRRSGCSNTPRKHYSGENAGDMKELRRRLIQAGYLDARAPALFFLARAVAAVALARPGLSRRALRCCATTAACSGRSVLVGGILGYFAPSIYLSRIIAVRQVEHRTGFPDFMDLLVVCADAGLSMEAALDRVGRELADSLSFALRQHPHGDARDARRPHARARRSIISPTGSGSKRRARSRRCCSNPRSSARR